MIPVGQVGGVMQNDLSMTSTLSVGWIVRLSQ
jgi:hypothetical protein